MKKNILLSSLLFATLFLGVSSAQAAPPPPAHGGPGGVHNMHRPPMHNMHTHRPPRMHHYHHVRHSGYISPCYCPSCYPVGLGTRIYYPVRHYGHLGASFHISI